MFNHLKVIVFSFYILFPVIGSASNFYFVNKTNYAIEVSYVLCNYEYDGDYICSSDENKFNIPANLHVVNPIQLPAYENKPGNYKIASIVGLKSMDSSLGTQKYYNTSQCFNKSSYSDSDNCATFDTRIIKNYSYPNVNYIIYFEDVGIGYILFRWGNAFVESI